MPYILNTEKERQEMLKVVGVKSVEDLYGQLPASIKLNQPLNLPLGLSEMEVKDRLGKLSCNNSTIDSYNSFLGAGCYDHYVPSALATIISKPEFLTAYTPYQAEASQGALQAIYEYQSYVCLLTGMDVSNASVFDGASAVAEAVLMAFRLTNKKQVLISEAVHPEYRQTLGTYLDGLDCKIKEIGFTGQGFIDTEALEKSVNDDVACFVVQSPNFLGLIEEVKKVSEVLHKRNALLILVTNPISLSILKSPVDLGVDIVCGDGQTLGGNLNFGGPSFGFLATKNEYFRQMPGRIIGKTQDKDGKVAYCLTMQTREQHIRREKATSNICSNQSLNAIAAAVYLSLMGKEGIKEVGLYSLNLAHYLYEQLKKINGVKIYNCRFFNEFIWEIDNAKKIVDKLYKKNIIAGLYIGKIYPEFKNCILSCCTEKKTKEDIDNFTLALKAIIE